MSLLEIAGDFLDRMLNPIYGTRVNEEYALRFARFMDGNTLSRLADEIQQTQSASAVSAHVWLWLLQWVRSRDDSSLNDDLLLELCELWESGSFKSEVIRTALQVRAAPATPSALSDRETGIENIPDPWLRRLVERATSDASLNDDFNEDPPQGNAFEAREHRHANSLLMALLFIGTDETIAAARAMLAHNWSGQEGLAGAFQARMDTLDEGTREVWRNRVQWVNGQRG